MLEALANPRDAASIRGQSGARMSWSTGAGLAVAACVLQASCSVVPCNPPPCPYANIDMHALNDSTFDWTYRDLLATAQSTGFVAAPPSGYDCSFRFNPGSVQPPGYTLPESFDPGSITLTCSGGLYGLFDIALSALGDIRDWPVGTFTLAPPVGTVKIVGFFGATPTLDGLAVTVTVEDAVGGSAPFPHLVTSDYVRTFRVDFDTASVAPKDANGRPDATVTAKVSLHLSQTAADYVGDPNAFCGCV
jgi:hypothetical protein